MTTRTRKPESLQALGETIAKLTPAEQADFLGSFITVHDRRANEIYQQTRGQEDGRPVWHDKLARLLTEVRRHMAAYPKKADK